MQDVSVLARRSASAAHVHANANVPRVANRANAPVPARRQAGIDHRCHRRITIERKTRRASASSSRPFGRLGEVLCGMLVAMTSEGSAKSATLPVLRWTKSYAVLAHADGRNLCRSHSVRK